MLPQLFHSLLWRTLLPVVVIGSVTSLLLNYFLVPPLLSIITERADKTISHTTYLAANICEESLSDILGLRMEEDVAMNISSQKEALQEIKKVATIFPNIKMAVFDSDGLLEGGSLSLNQFKPEEMLSLIDQLEARDADSTAVQLAGESIRANHEYFPFWRWYIVSFIPEEEYLAPINMAKRIVLLGTFGSLAVVVVSLIVLFLLQINRPLKQIIEATEEVRKGNFKQIGLTGDSEIEHVAVAFDEMVQKLDSDKKRIENILEELGESEEQYRVLFENSIALVIMLREETFLYANNAAQLFFGKSYDELIGSNIYKTLNSEECRIFREKIFSLEDNQKNVERFELPFHQGSDKERWLEILASHISFKGQKSILIHAIDITKRKVMKREQDSMRQKLERGERMEVLGTLAGGVAHDLNNILGGIVGYPELLMQGMKKGDKLLKPLETIHKSGVRAAAIVQDLLTLTRRGVVVTEIINLSDIIEEYLASPEFQTLSNHHPGITVQKEIAGDLFNTLGSRLHLSKTVMNLVSNAAEAMPDGGTIQILAQNCYIDKPFGHYEKIVDGEYVQLTVADSGQGIAQKDLVRIFEPFYTKKVMGRSGTGLGMSVVWGAVKDHDGYIEVDSAKGIGTTFKLYFPITRRAQERQKPEFTFTDHMGKGEKILVIDDIEEQRTIATAMLKQLGYTCESIDCGERAIEMLQSQNYDMLIIDMIMDPMMDGLETYKKVVEINPTQKAIIASGFSETDRVREALSIGVKAYIKKPYSLVTIAKTIKRHLAA